MKSEQTIRWNPFHSNDPSSFNFGQYALVVLNCRIETEPSVVVKLWNEANCRCTVDGGTDRWFDFLQTSGSTVDRRYPEIVSGDFDSIKRETLETCRTEGGCLIVETPDQNYTDFEKAVRLVMDKADFTVNSIVVICEFSGRVDQSMSILNLLRIGNEFAAQPKVFNLNSSSLTWHLNRGNHVVQIPQRLVDQKNWCSLLPFEPVENSVTTTGLKWNLSGHTIKFGGLISSSNTYDGSECVTIATDGELLWSMGI